MHAGRRYPSLILFPPLFPSSMELRKFLFACILIFFLNNVVEAAHRILPELQSLHATDVERLLRTGYHFQPPLHWINDPNGPMYYNGLYHLFYQYNPKGAVWGNIIWAHSVSKDLINWEALEPAIYPTDPFDINGCWSGSATILPDNKPVIFYTGIDHENRQVQNYAVPANLSDPYLREWVKPADNPIAVPEAGINVSAFRDPTTAWFTDGHWKMVVGSRRKHRGMAYLYRSRDFVHWIKAKHPLHSFPNTGMWECPDFYPVTVSGKQGLDTSVLGDYVKHVLKVSLDLTRFDYYMIGKYFPDKDTYVPDNTSADGWTGLRYDYGNFYASKTFFDPVKNRRILWGWANESDTAVDDAQKGWAGIQLIPRTVWLDPNGKQLLQWPVEELDSLRGKNIQISNQQLKLGDRVEVEGIDAAQADVEVTFSFSSLDKAEQFDPSWVDALKLCGQKGSTVQGGLGPFGLATLASTNLEEFTPVFFRIFKGQDKYVVLMCSDASHSSLKTSNSSLTISSSSLNYGMYKPSFAGFVDVDIASDKKLSLRSLIDNSVVESFGAGGKTCITSRVYPTLAVMEDAHLYAFNNGSEPIVMESLNAWSMKKPLKMNN